MSNNSNAVNEHRRMRRERRTLHVMVALWCRDRHGTSGELCQACQALDDYCMKRLDFCPFQEDKTTCVKCPVHCYAKKRREEIREVMRYAGPRMLLRHPYLAMRHLLDGWLRTKPDKSRKSIRSKSDHV